MSLLTVGKAPKQMRRLYLFDITLASGLKVVKIGVASGGSSLDRMMQVNRDYFQKYRTTFAAGIKRDREVPQDQVFKMEAILHRFFKNYQYQAKKKFDGCTELFVVPLQDAVDAMELVLSGEEPDFTYELPEQDPGASLDF